MADIIKLSIHYQSSDNQYEDKQYEILNNDCHLKMKRFSISGTTIKVL